MRRILFTLMSLACSVTLATTIYKWVDEYGVIHYSDQPHPNAEKLQVEGVQTYSANAAAVRAPVAADQNSPSANTYRGCAIVQPVDQQNLPNAESVMIRVVADPAPRGGDRVYISMDGQGLNGGQPTGPSFNVSTIDRGEHTVQAQIRGNDNAVLCQTPSVTFYVQQHTLFSPAGNGPPGVSPRPH